MKRIALAAILIFTAASGLDDGGPASPTFATVANHLPPQPAATGISIRDYFAASYIASRDALTGNDQTIVRHADMAYRIADAMIERRKR